MNNTTHDTILSSLYDYIDCVNLCDTLSLQKDITLIFLAQGEYNQNFILSDAHHRYVLRVNFGSQIQVEKQIEYEFNVLQAVHPSGVTPKGYFVDASLEYFDQGILVMEYLEGRPLHYHTDLAIAAHIFQSIHRVPISDTMPLIREMSLFSDRIKEAHVLLTEVWDSPVLSKEVLQILHKILEYAQKNEHEQAYFLEYPLHCITNTEVNSRNFIVQDAHSSYLVDWEKAVISDPCQDITHFLAPTTTLWKTDTILNAEEQERFFSAYEMSFMKENPFPIRERVRMYNPYLYLRAISWCCFALVEYNKPNRTISNEDTYKKILQYLQPDFLETLFKDII